MALDKNKPITIQSSLLCWSAALLHRSALKCSILLHRREKIPLCEYEK